MTKFSDDPNPQEGARGKGPSQSFSMLAKIYLTKKIMMKLNAKLKKL